MVGLVERKLSKSAFWCRRLAVFAVPYFLITIIMHRWDNITTNQTMGLLAFGFVILVFSVLFAIHAIVQLWNDGTKGGKVMIFGLFLSILMLSPFVVYALLAMRLPAINDVSTNMNSPPSYGEKALNIRRGKDIPPANAVDDGYSEVEITSILTAYPKISPRRYPAGPERVLEAVREIITDRGWTITQLRGLPAADEPAVEPKEQAGREGDDEHARREEKPAPPTAVGSEPDAIESAHLNDMFVDAVTSSTIFAFKNDVVIKIISEEENTLVEMRSASRWGVHDFGANAQTIENFMADLDQNLLGIAGEG